MNATARAFAIVDLAVAKGLHSQGVDLGGVETQRILDVANQADYEHLIVSGMSVEAVRSPDGRHWCPIVLHDGKAATLCRGGAIVGPFIAKKRPATCPECLGAFDN